MELQSNVKIDADMDKRIKRDDLSSIDRIKLVLANFVAMCFPDQFVYINPNRQNTNCPCFFVSLYEIRKKRGMQSTAKYEIGFVISYVPESSLHETRTHDVIFLLQQHITDLTEYPVQSVGSDVTDEVANITGVIAVREKNLSEDPITRKAEKELVR